jgi:HTH-type transcriptional regulator / antitoxin HigA
LKGQVLVDAHVEDFVAEAFPVGEYLRDEIEARDWSVGEFATIIGRPVQALSEILNGKKDLTVETATEIAAATDTEASTWLNLQNRYKLWLQASVQGAKLSDIERRARLSALVPMAELRKRGLIEAGDIDFEEKQVCNVLRISTTRQRPDFMLAARRTLEAEPLSAPQIAWLGFSRHVAAQAKLTRPFDIDALTELGATLTRTVTSIESVETLPDRFADVGVRLIHFAAFKSGKIDGAAFEDDAGPVVVVSARGFAMDKLIFTILHEVAHVVLRHTEESVAFDDDIAAEPMTKQERDADRLAAEWVLPKPILIGRRVSRSEVEKFAAQVGVHPAMVVGRLHHDGIVPWTHLNGLVPSVSAWSKTGRHSNDG